MVTVGKMHDEIFMGKQQFAEMYFIKPKYMPKVWTPKENSFSSQMHGTLQNNTQPNGSEKNDMLTSGLTEEEKTELLNQFNAGQGKLSMEQWDDFLLSLVDLGLITNGTRLEALGFLVPIADDISGTGNGNSTYDTKLSEMLPLNMWDDDPVKWLEDMDFYLYKKILYAQQNHYGTGSLEQTREDLKKIAQIIDELLNDSKHF